MKRHKNESSLLFSQNYIQVSIVRARVPLDGQVLVVRLRDSFCGHP